MLTPLPACRHRGDEISPDRWVCRSPWLVVPAGIVSGDVCRSECSYVDFAADPPAGRKSRGSRVEGLEPENSENANSASRLPAATAVEVRPEMLSIAMISAPRPVATVDLSLAELRRGGFSQSVTVFEEPETHVAQLDGVRVVTAERRLGMWRNWQRAARTMLAETDSPFILLCEDDLRLCPAAAAALQHAIDTLPHESWGYASLYTPLHNTARRTLSSGWQQIDLGWCAWGALAYCFTRHSLESVLEHPRARNHRSDRGTDAVVSAALSDLKLRCYYHIPSLCEHTGGGISSVGHAPHRDHAAEQFAADYGGYVAVPVDETRAKPSSPGRKAQRPDAGAGVERVAAAPQPARPRVIHGTTQIPAGPRPRYACDVVIPYFHGLRWLPATIEAILSQVAVDVTVHLINDCSPEDDTAIRREFAGVGNLWWYRNKTNLGPYVTYHQVWPYLDSDYFAVQDADDLPLPNRLWRAIHALETSGAELYGAAMEQFVTPGSRDPENAAYIENMPIHRSGVDVGDRYTPHGVLINGTMVCRRETFARLNGFFDCFPTGADTEFVTRAHFAGCRFFIDSAVVALRRVHDHSLSRSGRWKAHTPDWNAMLAEIDRRCRLSREAGRAFDPHPLGALDRARPELTERVQ
jgi:hypothetical protein